MLAPHSRAPRPPCRRIRARGFTLIELMVALAVAALLFAIGVPMLRDVTLGSRLSAAANDLLASVQLARSEAIKRNLAVTLCASDDGATCAAAGGWELGWIVVDGAGTVIQLQSAQPAGYRMTQAGGTLPLTFQPIGIGASPAVITVCRFDPLGSQERVLTVRTSGSAQVTATTAGACP
jgi:type IV fimbrial biogenesis protein FimT